MARRSPRSSPARRISTSSAASIANAGGAPNFAADEVPPDTSSRGVTPHAGDARRHPEGPRPRDFPIQNSGRLKTFSSRVAETPIAVLVPEDRESWARGGRDRDRPTLASAFAPAFAAALALLVH